jgi:hypothetical protein
MSGNWLYRITFALRCLQAWQAVLTEVRLGIFSLKGGLEPEGPSRTGPGNKVRSRLEAALSSIFHYSSWG